MNKTTQKIVETLKSINGDGSFACYGTSNFVFPNIEILDGPEMSYPVTEDLAKKLISVAKPAPFGHGMETKIDNSVRNAWEIDADKIIFNDGAFKKLVQTNLKDIKVKLGIEDYEIRADLYKMLVYEPGGFFLTHKDSEKEKGMFGTMVIALPSKHQGGELLVSFNGKSKSINFDQDCSAGRLPYAAFYADCDHEIKEITAGYRVVLVYNLIQVTAKNPLKAYSLDEHTAAIVGLLKSEVQSFESMLPRIILLGHQYTPENFSYDGLKLEDRAKAVVLLDAANQADYYAALCLVTSFKSGAPDGWNSDDEDAEMIEIYVEEVSFERWFGNNGIPTLRRIINEEEDLIPLFDVDDHEPLVKENTGYMGNYGPDLNHWYHYGAVVLWPKSIHKDLLPGESDEVLLSWLNYYSDNYNSINHEEKMAVDVILEELLKIELSSYRNYDFSAVPSLFLRHRDLESFQKYGVPVITKFIEHIKLSLVAGLVEAYGSTVLMEIKKHILSNLSLKSSEKYLQLLIKIASNVPNEVSQELSELPLLFTKLIMNIDKGKPVVTKESLRVILQLFQHFPKDLAWQNKVVEQILSCTEREYDNDVIAHEVLRNKDINELKGRLILEVQMRIQKRVDNEPQPFPDFRRPIPDEPSYYKQLNIIQDFMNDPNSESFDYKAVQNLRNQMENAIQNISIDLKMQTISKGSPYTLRLTKTDESYRRNHEQWKADVQLLRKLKIA